MVNASGHIEQQLSKLQTQTAAIATELESLVDDYLKVLSQASKRQLVLAAYHVCTQIYPDNFLELSLSQRDRLQQQLRELGNRIHPQFCDKWETAKRLSLRPAEEDGLAVIRQLFLEAASAREQSNSDNSQSTDKESPATAQSSDKPSSELTESSPQRPPETLLADIQTLIDSDRTDVPDSEPSGPMQPAQIMRRQILIEKAIRDVLKTASEQANDILQKANVMPELPQALLSAASDAERLGQTPMKTPNLVRLSIKVIHEPGNDIDKDAFEPESGSESADEAQSESWSEEAEISASIITREDISEPPTDETDDSPESSESMPRFLQIDALPEFVVIHLRLAEIEFAETNTAVWRSRIRKKMGQLKRVGHAYKDAERQLAIARAEDAWRASWTND
ncbi:MAG: hypothetical protein ACFB2W_22350 [Leptolyngbyaceae cyanobacterium]